MNKKLNKIAIIFLILMMAIPIFSFTVGATESTIFDNVYSISANGDNIVVDNNGNLFASYYNRANNYFYVDISNDNGTTWTQSVEITNVHANSYPAHTLLVNNTGHVFCFYLFSSGLSYSLKYRLWDGSSWSSHTAFAVGNSLASFGGLDAVCNSENIYIAISYKDSTSVWRIKYAQFNFFLDTWGTASNIVSGGTQTCNYPNLCIHNDLYVFYNNNSNIEYAKYDISSDSWSLHTAVDTTYAYAFSNAISVGSTMYLFYEGTTATSNGMDAILYKEYTTSFGIEQTICEDSSYDQHSPFASRNTNGNINVIWYGKSSLSTAYTQLRQRIYSSGTWNDIAFISIGAENKRYPHLVYKDYPTFTHLSDDVSLVYFDSDNNCLEYIDSGSLSWYSGESAEYEGDFEFDANNNIGTLDTGCTMGVGYKDVEFKYQIPSTINATGFDLLVSPDMHSYSNDLSNYDLSINGELMGNPTEWKTYSNKYVLRWTFASEKVIDNSEILFEVWHDVSIFGNYWYLGGSCNYEDLDGDGIATMRYSNTYPNGAFDGTWLAKDVAYQLYFNIISFVEDETDVTYNSISFLNTTYYIGDSVPLTYTIKASDLVYDNYVRIWNDDTATEITAGTMQGFPYLCTHQVETIGFVPHTSANYTAHLYINGASVDNVSFFANEQINSDMHVFTYPNPSKVGQKVWVSYNFDHPTNKSGAIFLSYTPNLNNYISVNYLSDGDSGFWTTTYDTVGIYYYIIAVDINGNGTYGIVNNGVHAHYVRSEHGNNYFTLGGYNLRLNTEGTVTQIVNGECNMVSGNCYIYDNNQLVKTITESPFSYSYEVHTAGLHTVEMRLITNVTTILCTQNYTVTTYSGEDEIEQVEDSGYVVRDWLYNNYGDFGIFIAGVLIILGFMFLPFGLVLYVNVAYNKNVNLGDIHWGIYLIFAIVGVIVVIQLHLADLWIVLLICVVSIAITVISYNGRNG